MVKTSVFNHSFQQHLRKFNYLHNFFIAQKISICKIIIKKIFRNSCYKINLNQKISIRYAENIVLQNEIKNSKTKKLKGPTNS